MIDRMDNDSPNRTVPAPPGSEGTIQTPPEISPDGVNQGQIVTRAKLRARQRFQQNRFVLIGSGALVVALLAFVATLNSQKSPVRAMEPGTVATRREGEHAPNTAGNRSLFPVTDSGNAVTKEVDQGFLNEKALEGSAISPSHGGTVRPSQWNASETLGSIPPFGQGKPEWRAPSSGASTAPEDNTEVDPSNAERDAMEEPSLIYVRNVSVNGVDHQAQDPIALPAVHVGLGLPTGTRLRAHLEMAASTAIRVPVLAVIEYTYERDGQIVIPAGAKAVGYIQEADRSGYVRIQFESLIMPDGATIPIQAAATDLDMKPLRGRVEGRNPGKNILVRSLSGIGQAGALLLGKNSLNGPLSEADLVRGRLSNNIGEASSEEVSRMAMNSRIVVTVSASTPIYVVLEQTPGTNAPAGQSGN